jgi:hypothetical protein
MKRLDFLKLSNLGAGGLLLLNSTDGISDPKIIQHEYTLSDLIELDWNTVYLDIHRDEGKIFNVVLSIQYTHTRPVQPFKIKNITNAEYEPGFWRPMDSMWFTIPFPSIDAMNEVLQQELPYKHFYTKTYFIRWKLTLNRNYNNIDSIYFNTNSDTMIEYWVKLKHEHTYSKTMVGFLRDPNNDYRL